MKRVAAVLFLLLLPFTAAYAETNEEKLKQLEEKIKAHQRKLKDIRRAESSILDELEGTQRELEITGSELKRQREVLAATEADTRKTAGEVARLKGKLDERSAWLKRKLRAAYTQARFGDVLLLVAGAEDFSQLLRRLEYLDRLASYEHKVMTAFRADYEALSRKKKSLEALHARLKSQEEAIRRTQESLALKKTRKEMLLASVKKEKVLYEKMLQEMEEASKRLVEIIRESETKGELAEGNFRLLKGKLPWPVPGEVALPYGKQKDPQFNIEVFRNGVHIKAAPGATTRAVHDGKVVFADWFKGYGKLVILNHGGGYHSLYANLSEIFLNIGDIIKKGAAVGRVGESPMLETLTLYFEIRYKGKPLDPLQWLEKR